MAVGEFASIRDTRGERVCKVHNKKREQDKMKENLL